MAPYTPKHYTLLCYLPSGLYGTDNSRNREVFTAVMLVLAMGVTRSELGPTRSEKKLS